MQVPLINEVRKLGLKVIVSDLSDLCVCRDLADIFVHRDIFDIKGHINDARKLIKQGKKIVGALAAGIDAPETMAQLAKFLGLPGVKPSIARLVHEKHEFRRKLKLLGYPVPKFAVIDAKTIGKIEEIVNGIGFPLIVKNSDSSGSRGTKIFRQKNLKNIKKSVKEAMAVSKSKKALIEQCWEGQEATVETIFDISGKFHPCFITDRFFDRSKGFAMETGLRHPSALPAKTQSEMFALAKNVAQDLGVKIGAAKYDIMVTRDGPRIIEMTVRLSGGFDCQYLVPASTGKQVMKAAVLTALGKKFPAEILKDVKHRIGLSESLWPNPGKIVKIEGVEEAKRIFGVEHIFFRYKVGETVAPYTDCTKRVCFIIVTGKDERDAYETTAKAKKIIKIVTK